jgi:hypothetical protein
MLSWMTPKLAQQVANAEFYAAQAAAARKAAARKAHHGVPRPPHAISSKKP